MQQICIQTQKKKITHENKQKCKNKFKYNEMCNFVIMTATWYGFC